MIFETLTDHNIIIVLAESIAKYHSITEIVFFNEYLLEAKQSTIFMQELLQEEKSFHLCMSRILLTAKQSWATLLMSRPLLIYRQLFAGHVVGSRPIKRKKNLQQLIIQCVMCMLKVEKCRLISNKLLLDKAEYSYDK